MSAARLVCLAVLCACAAWVCSGCAIRRAPAQEVRSSLGVVRAHELAQAQRISDTLLELAPAIARELDVDLKVMPPIELMAARSSKPQSWHGYTTRAGIHFETSGGPIERHCLAHELVHFFNFHDPARRWVNLPPMAVEGIAELVALRVVPEVRPDRIAMLRQAIESIEKPFDLELACAMSAEEWAAKHSGAEHDTYYGLSLLIAHHIGFHGLAQMCEASFLEENERVRAERLIRRAGLQGTGPVDWLAQMDSAFRVAPAGSQGENRMLMVFYDAKGNELAREFTSENMAGSIPKGTASVQTRMLPPYDLRN